MEAAFGTSNTGCGFVGGGGGGGERRQTLPTETAIEQLTLDPQ